jgi:catalase
VAAKLGLPLPDPEQTPETTTSPALSQLNRATESIATRKVAVLAADGVDVKGVEKVKSALTNGGAIVEILAPHGGTVSGGSGGELAVDRVLNTMASVLYDAVIVPCGPDSVPTLSSDGYAVHFVAEAYKHAKAVGAFGKGLDLLRTAGITEQLADDTEVTESNGVVTSTAAQDDLSDSFAEEFAKSLAQHRAWARRTEAVPA